MGNTINLAVFSKILESINLIEKSGINYTFRTTVVKGLHTSSEISALHMRCGKHYAIQNYNPEIVLKPNIKFERFSNNDFKGSLGKYAK